MVNSTGMLDVAAALGYMHSKAQKSLHLSFGRETFATKQNDCVGLLLPSRMMVNLRS